ncbi:MAG: putative cytokinetic ring protein SteA, partial [Acidimicrobiia bacterium]
MARRSGTRRQKGAADTVKGPARVDKRTKDLSRRMQPGDIAVINHTDIDRVAGENLVAQGAAAVINGGESISGRYPNGGPIRIVEAGVPLIDAVGPEILSLVVEGDELRIVGGEVWRGDELIATGTPLDRESIEAAMETARGNIGVELEKFAENTLEYIQREARLTFEPILLPELRTHIRGRHALVVVRGHDYRSDLAALKPYLREYQPVLIGVDGGADALLEIGFEPDIIIGDFDSVSDRA